MSGRDVQTLSKKLALRQAIDARALRRILPAQRKAIQKSLHPGTFSSPSAKTVRFAFCGDESSSEVRATLREADRNYKQRFGAIGRVDITSWYRQIRSFA